MNKTHIREDYDVLGTRTSTTWRENSLSGPEAGTIAVGRAAAACGPFRVTDQVPD